MALTRDEKVKLQKLRRQAEGFLPKQSLEWSELSPQEMQHLVHELEVYQTQLEQQSQARTRELAALLKIAQNVVSLRPELLLGLILDQLKEIVDYQGAAILLVEGDHLVSLAYRGPMEPENMGGWWMEMEDWPANQEVLNEQKPIIVADIHDPAAFGSVLQPIGQAKLEAIFGHIHSWLGVPLIVKKWTIGLLVLTHHKPNYYSAYQAELVMAFAQQVAITLENDRLYQQVHHLATQAERDRLARAMHDELAQSVSYISIKASIALDLLANGQIDQVQAHLLELKQVTSDTYANVREAIFSLRTESPAGSAFLPRLREYLTQYQTQYKVEIQLLVDDERLTEFSAEVGIQVMRIIQEALINVRKHAQAKRVLIHFEQEQDQVRIRIVDNGQGFDPEQQQGEDQLRFGLQVMRERAESVDGRMEVISMPGWGTQILVQVPLGFS